MVWCNLVPRVSLFQGTGRRDTLGARLGVVVKITNKRKVNKNKNIPYTQSEALQCSA